MMKRLIIAAYLVASVPLFAQFEDYDAIIARAKTAFPNSPHTSWETKFEEDEADILGFLGSDSIVIATTQVGASGGPLAGSLMMLNATTGQVIWKQDRPADPLNFIFLGFGNGSIQFVRIRPQSNYYYSYSTRDGKKLWELEVKKASHVTDSTSIMIWSEGNLQQLNRKTGQPVWKVSLESSGTQEMRNPPLIFGKNLLLVDDHLTLIDKSTGKILWKVKPGVDLTKNPGVSIYLDRLVIWNPKVIQVLDLTNGSVLFTKEETTGSNINVTLQDGILLRAYLPNASDQGHIQSLDPKAGLLLWEQTISGTLVSPLHVRDGRLIFSTDGFVYALKVQEGIVEWKTPFGGEFERFAPSKLILPVFPDKFRFAGDTFFLSRELAGVNGYSAHDGKQLWSQLNINHAVQGNPYYLAQTTAVLQATLAKYGTATSPGVNAYSYANSAANVNPFLETAQRSHDYTMSRTQEVLNNSRSTRSERQSAHGSRALSFGLLESQMSTSMAMERMTANVNAIMSATAGIVMLLDAATKTGVISRLMMKINGSNDMQEHCFQGNYHLRPFLYENLGVTITELSTGRRCDLIYSPYSKTLDDYNLELPVFRISADNKTLVTSGIGLNPDAFEKGKKIKVAYSLKFLALPKPSVLTYQMTNLEFSETTPLLKKVTEERQVAVANFPLHDAAAGGNLEEMRRLIEEGADIDQQYANGLGTPLSYAATMGEDEAIQLLLEKGADINIPMALGSTTPFIMAVKMGKLKTAKLLAEKGADPNIKTQNGQTAMYYAEQIQDKKLRNEMVAFLKGLGLK